MQFSRIRISARSQNLLSLLKRRTGLTPNILSRFAICLSLKDPSMPNTEEFDEKGSELSPNVLFGEHEKIFMALMLNRLHKDRLEPSIYLQKMTRAHLNRGVIALYPRLNDLSDFYELIKEEKT